MGHTEDKVTGDDVSRFSEPGYYVRENRKRVGEKE